MSKGIGKAQAEVEAQTQKNRGAGVCANAVTDRGGDINRGADTNRGAGTGIGVGVGIVYIFLISLVDRRLNFRL